MDLAENHVKSYEEILEAYVMVLANLKEIMQEDVMVLITNRTDALCHYSGYKLNTKVDSSFKVSDHPHLVEAMRTGKIRSDIMSKERYGIPFASFTYPIKAPDGEIIGCVGIGKSLEKEGRVEEISQGLAATLQQANAGLQEVASGSQGLSFKISNVVKSANESAVKIKEINKVISAISDISSHSNLLGLNAAIEAARAGEQGRGFAVVAEEMRKLAAQSNDSAKMVNEILTQMRESIEGIINEINQIGGIAENQAAATQEITAAIEEVSENSQNLVELSKITFDYK
ncbi:MAG: chemotaxis protein [Dehalobacter sp. 4CP]|uniref:methyl-accepting chemotaxis protein n=1 Tax=Dehalobacter sp. CP TaxID=2594474 RepID=UPI0013C6AC91|nr:methyl-accepting chemotaxis protein [Dehalobacter sp.]NBJ16816.1 chemotaxis protein [Dehalobacter sp. 4CP]